jgi:hypothetical protein
MKQVVVFPRGQLSERDRKRLSRSGVVIVEADDPSKVVSLLPTPPLPADEMMALALEHLAASGSSSNVHAFVKNLGQAIKRRLTS